MFGMGSSKPREERVKKKATRIEKKPKITHRDLAPLREEYLQRQGGICPLCGKPIDPSEVVLDHDHFKGNCRMALHRTCNALEGKTINWILRFGRGINPSEFLSNLVQYWGMDFSKNPIHPTHKTDIDKEILKLQRRIKAVKKQETKDKYTKELNKLIAERDKNLGIYNESAREDHNIDDLDV